MAGAGDTQRDEMLNVSINIVSKVMSACKKVRKTSSTIPNSRRKPKHSERGRRILKRNVKKNRKIAAELSDNLEILISIETVGRELHKSESYVRAPIMNLLLSERSVTKGLAWRKKSYRLGPERREEECYFLEQVILYFTYFQASV